MKRSKLKGRPRGRPRLRYKGLAIVMRLPPNELKALDRWIKAELRVAFSAASDPEDSQRRARDGIRWRGSAKGLN